MNSVSSYDAQVNFNHPVPTSVLETSRVKLIPFLPHVHGDEFHAKLSAHPELTQFLPCAFTPAIIQELLRDPESVLFAVIDKTKGDGDDAHGTWGFAGMIGLLHTSSQNLCTEIGPVICFPEFQRTFVTSNAVAILLRYCLNVPAHGGLGFRRVQWTAHPANVASIKTAERMGMKREGVLRWTWVLPLGVEGMQVPPERGQGAGRDSVLLAAYWDDWENGGREHVDKIVDRQS
ncbi:acyl-CoA N-acyltransferase [Mycena pura]|uniref:Acyl-CoA N-acyltransferase n=1 Tax=Mycena pura TaxID=153505 RepID=A0AAD6YRL2_9AGAR|nr:acyl-CoA N-acyltransferase [Mycena pura]